MATAFPGSADTFATTSPTNLGDDDAQARNHAERHDAMGSAMNAVQAFALGSAFSMWHQPMSVGDYYAPATTLAAAIRAEGYEVGHLFVPQRSCTLDRLAIYVTVAGSTGAVVRLGIRNWNASTGLPGGVLLDAGTVVTETSTAVAEATISQAVVAGTPYFLSATCQGGATTRPTVMTLGTRATPAAESAPSSATNPNPAVTGVTGALAESPSWSVIAYSIPRIWVRAGA